MPSRQRARLPAVPASCCSAGPAGGRLRQPRSGAAAAARRHTFTPPTCGTSMARWPKRCSMVSPCPGALTTPDCSKGGAGRGIRAGGRSAERQRRRQLVAGRLHASRQAACVLKHMAHTRGPHHAPQAQAHTTWRSRLPPAGRPAPTLSTSRGTAVAMLAPAPVWGPAAAMAVFSSSVRCGVAREAVAGEPPAPGRALQGRRAQRASILGLRGGGASALAGARAPRASGRPRARQCPARASGLPGGASRGRRPAQVGERDVDVPGPACQCRGRQRQRVAR
jgi:hypothetical protein